MTACITRHFIIPRNKDIDLRHIGGMYSNQMDAFSPEEHVCHDEKRWRNKGGWGGRERGETKQLTGSTPVLVIVLVRSEKIASVLGSPSAELRNDQRAFMKVRLRSLVQLVYDRWPI